MNVSIPLRRRQRIGRNLQDLRWKYNLKQCEIAGLTQATVHQHETGAVAPNLRAIECYIKCYGLEAVEEALEWR